MNEELTKALIYNVIHKHFPLLTFEFLYWDQEMDPTNHGHTSHTLTKDTELSPLTHALSLDPGDMHKGSSTLIHTSNPTSHGPVQSCRSNLQAKASRFLGNFPGCVACVSKKATTHSNSFRPRPPFIDDCIRAWLFLVLCLGWGGGVPFLIMDALSVLFSCSYRPPYRQVKGTFRCERLFFFGICCVS
jgi:hypothetical protein